MSAAFLGQFQEYLVNQAEFSENEKKEFRWRQMAFRAFALIMLVLGVPAWWLTTTPYRAHLPSLESTYAANLQQRLRSYQRDGAEVWDNLELHSNYNLHFIFIIDGLGGQRDVFASREIERKIAIFTQKYLQPIGVKVRISAEFLWDFSLDDFLLDHSPNVVKIIDSSSQIPASLATQLDMLDTPPVRQDPLLKIAIFFSTDRESSPHRIEHKGQPADGLAIASWGAIFVHDGDQQKLLNAIMASLLLQLSIAPSGAEQPCLNETLKWHQQRLALHNLLQTVQILNSLHELASTIEDLVISDEVASLAAQSQAQFLKEYNRLMQKSQIDSESAAQARRLAERANGDQSLLELLNFPSDQKYGIYVPLFLPLLVPLLQPLALFLLFLLTRLKAGWRNRKNNNNSGGDMGEKKTK